MNAVRKLDWQSLVVPGYAGIAAILAVSVWTVLAYPWADKGSQISWLPHPLVGLFIVLGVVLGAAILLWRFTYSIVHSYLEKRTSGKGLDSYARSIPGFMLTVMATAVFLVVLTAYVTSAVLYCLMALFLYVIFLRVSSIPFKGAKP